MSESQNKTVHFQYKISCIDSNVTVIHDDDDDDDDDADCCFTATFVHMVG